MNQYNTDPAFKTSTNDRPVKLAGPVYFLAMENHVGSKNKCYLVSRLDEYPSMVKFIGIEILEKDVKKFNDILSKSDKSLYEEIQVPWNRIYKIQNLTYKHK